MVFGIVQTIFSLSRAMRKRDKKKKIKTFVLAASFVLTIFDSLQGKDRLGQGITVWFL